MYSTREVLQLLRDANCNKTIREEWIRRAIRREDAVPSATFAGRLAWTRSDIVRLAGALGLTPPEVWTPDERQAGAPANHRRRVPRRDYRADRRDAGLFRTVTIHRTFELATGGQLRQLLCRQIRQRVLRKPGPARPPCAGALLPRRRAAGAGLDARGRPARAPLARAAGGRLSARDDR